MLITRKVFDVRLARQALLLVGLGASLLLAPTAASAHECPPNSGFLLEPIDYSPANGNVKVQVCHRTGSATNPYVIIEVGFEAVCRAHQSPDEHDPTGNNPFPNGDVIPDNFDPSRCNATGGGRP